MTIEFNSTHLAGFATDCTDSVQGFQISPADEVQILPVVGSAKPLIKNRKNRRYNITWTVQKTHATTAAAETYLLSHSQLFTAVGNLKITHAGGNEQYNPADVKHVGTFAGCVSKHTYTAVGTLS